MNLLSNTQSYEDLPDEFYEFCSQFVYNQGSWAAQTDTDSLMLLLWRMHRRIEELESR